MNTEAPLTPSQQLRRTWRQWSKLARVRIGFVLLLIVAISAWSVWWPRRGMVAVAAMGGSFDDPQMSNRIQIASRRPPDPILSLIGPWLGPHLHWLTADDRIESVNLFEVYLRQPNLTPLKRFPRLNSLILQGRHLGPGLERLATMNSLRSVYVGGMERTTDLGELRHLPNLEEVVLGSAPATVGGIERLSLLPKLETIVFNHSPSSLAMHGLGQCVELKSLVLSGGIDDPECLRFLPQLRKLRDLHVNGGSSVEVNGLTYIAKTPSLESLFLLSTEVTDEELQVLAVLTKLKGLDIRGSNITQAGIDRLKTAMPNCNIRWP